MRFFDTHCHLDFEAFDADRDEVLRRSGEKGVKHLLIPGVTPKQWPRVKKLGELGRIFYGLGLHPYWVAEWSLQYGGDGLNELERLFRAELNKVEQGHLLAIAECGLDKAIQLPLTTQKAYFVLQLNMAKAFQLPAVVHVRQAHAEVQHELKVAGLSQGGVIHGFSGSYEIAKSYWDLGFRLGVGGVITYDRASKTRKAISKMPLEAIVLESDAPDMPHFGKQGLRNSPEYLPDVAAVLSELKGMPLTEISEACFANSMQLYGL